LGESALALWPDYDFLRGHESHELRLSLPWKQGEFLLGFMTLLGLRTIPDFQSDLPHRKSESKRDPQMGYFEDLGITKSHYLVFIPRKVVKKSFVYKEGDGILGRNN